MDGGNNQASIQFGSVQFGSVQFGSVQGVTFLVDLTNSLLQFLYRLHHQSETFTKVAITFLHPGSLQLLNPRQDAIQLLLHLPLLLQFSQQSLFGADLCLVGSLQVRHGRLQPQHNLTVRREKTLHLLLSHTTFIQPTAGTNAPNTLDFIFQEKVW